MRFVIPIGEMQVSSSSLAAAGGASVGDGGCKRLI